MAKVPCRLAALDLDGTLLTDDHVVTDRSCEVLQELSAQGVVVVLISGRMHRSSKTCSACGAKDKDQSLLGRTIAAIVGIPKTET